MIIAYDFDGTLVEDRWPDIGPKTKWFDLALKLQKNHKLILWTCRTGDLLTAAVEFCKQNGLVFCAVNENLPEIVKVYGTDNRKISADIYIDDRAINVHCKKCTDILEKMLEHDMISSSIIKNLYEGDPNGSEDN